MQDIELVKEIIPLIDEEIHLVKTIIEQNHKDLGSTKTAPLLVFYTAPEKRHVAISTSEQGDFVDVVCRISEAMNIYPLIDAYSAIISMNFNVDIDGEKIPAINMFALSFTHAWSITIPYKIQNDEVFWLNDNINVSHIDDLELDDETRQMVSMFYVYVNVNNLHYTLPELLSYLSTIGAAVKFIDDDAPSFFDMSNGEFLQKVSND